MYTKTILACLLVNACWKCISGWQVMSTTTKNSVQPTTPSTTTQPTTTKSLTCLRCEWFRLDPKVFPECAGCIYTTPSFPDWKKEKCGPYVMSKFLCNDVLHSAKRSYPAECHVKCKALFPKQYEISKQINLKFVSRTSTAPFIFYKLPIGFIDKTPTVGFPKKQSPSGITDNTPIATFPKKHEAEERQDSIPQTMYISSSPDNLNLTLLTVIAAGIFIIIMIILWLVCFKLNIRTLYKEPVSKMNINTLDYLKV